MLLTLCRQAETQLFSGGPCHALGCEPEHCVQIIQLPDKTSIQESVPATFKNLYPDTRVIIDSAEIETDRSHKPILSL